MDKKNVRVFFRKYDRAVYIAHLDLMRTMQRTLKRSGLPVWYSEGFNPRLYLNFPLALSLGVTGEREPMDMAVVEDISLDEAVRRLNAAAPEGIEFISAAYPVHHNKEIGFAEYEAVFSGDFTELSEAADSFMSRETINVMKHTKKKGMVEVDIRPHITILGKEKSDRGMTLRYRLPAGLELNLNSAVLTDAFIAHCIEHNVETKLICAKRTNILCADGADFE